VTAHEEIWADPSRSRQEKSGLICAPQGIEVKIGEVAWASCPSLGLRVSPFPPIPGRALTSGTGKYAGAHGTLTVRDINPTETIAEMAITPRVGAVLHAGVEAQPPTDAAFRDRASTVCNAAAAKIAHLPRFSFRNFDPLHPDKTVLPKVGRFFAGSGDARPALRTLARKLADPGAPPAAKSMWSQAPASRRVVLVVRDAQIRAALSGDVPAFVASVHVVGKTVAEVPMFATAFGVDACTLG
jgi:hypothetical protein